MKTERKRHTLKVGGTARITFASIDFRKKRRRLAYAGPVREAAAAGGGQGCILASLLFGARCQSLESDCNNGWAA